MSYVVRNKYRQAEEASLCACVCEYDVLKEYRLKALNRIKFGLLHSLFFIHLQFI